MRAHYLQHVPFEGLGSIETWLQAKDYSVTCTSFYELTELPSASEIDLLVVMGGPMSVNDEQEYPWLVEERAFIRRAIAAGVPVLGICLGAQLIAHALGAEVRKNPEKEIGWFPIHGVDSSSTSFFTFPPKMEVFHWHGETFDLPYGARRLASSEACENQAFQIDKSVIGLQFHLETTQASAQALIENCRDELVPERFVQSESELSNVGKEAYWSINQVMYQVLDYLTR